MCILVQGLSVSACPPSWRLLALLLAPQPPSCDSCWHAGLIIGPRGNTQKRMQRETNCKIAIRGRGSIKEGISKDPKYDYGEDEELHVLITGESQEDVSGRHDWLAGGGAAAARAERAGSGVWAVGSCSQQEGCTKCVIWWRSLKLHCRPHNRHRGCCACACSGYWMCAACCSFVEHLPCLRTVPGPLPSPSCRQVDRASAMVEKLCTPSDDEHNEHKRLQLRELAALNGTLKDITACFICGDEGHDAEHCPKKVGGGSSACWSVDSLAWPHHCTVRGGATLPPVYEVAACLDTAMALHSMHSSGGRCG